MDNFDEESNQMLTKLKEFANTIKESQSILFCVRCGSTKIDQTAIYKLECIRCGSNVLWDGYTIAVARDGSAHDAASSFRTLETSFDYYKDWHFLAIREIQNFSRSLINFVGEHKKEGAEYEALMKLWDQLKYRMDGLISKAKAAP